MRFGPGLGGIGSVIVERDTPGFTIGQPSSFMSGEEWCELHFDNCRIPAENVLLGPGGFKKQMAGFNIERLGNTARSLAFGRYAFDQAREHALTREQFGRPLCEFQGLQWKFAEMAIKLEGAQLLLYRAAANADRGLPSAYETAVAKVACNQAGFEVANEAVQIMGATGYSRESAGGMLHAALPRLDDRRRLGRDPQEPHRRARLRPPLRPASAQTMPRPRSEPARSAVFAALGRHRRPVGRCQQDRGPAAEILRADSAMPAASIRSIRGARRVLGERAWPSLAALPEVPDHAYIVTPTEAAVAAVEECGPLGVKVATVLADGFAEAGARRRRARARACARSARSTGIRLVGPSSLGVVDLRTKAMLTANAAFDETDLPVGPHLRGVAQRQHDRRAAHRAARRAASASPAWSRSATRSTSRSAKSARRRSMIPASTATCCSSRPCGTPMRCAASRSRAAERGKPIIAYKLGRSAAARELAVSHTGALAGEDDVADVFLADCGIARVDTLDGLIEGLPLLSRACRLARSGGRARTSAS